MAKFTLLEVHLDDATLTANAPFRRGSDDPGSGTDPDSGRTTGDTDDTDGTRSGLPVVPIAVGLVVLLVLAAVLRRLIGGAGQEISDDETA